MDQNATHHGRYYKLGGTFGVRIPPDVRRELKLVPGDHMLMWVQGDLIIMRKVTRAAMLAGQSLNLTGIFPHERGET